MFSFLLGSVGIPDKKDGNIALVLAESLFGTVLFITENLVNCFKLIEIVFNYTIIENETYLAFIISQYLINILWDWKAIRKVF